MSEPTLDPTIRSWLDHIASVPPPRGASPYEERESARRLNDLMFAEFGIPARGGATRRTHRIGTEHGLLRVDEYRPSKEPGALPAILAFHGGSFRLGMIDELINVTFSEMRALDARQAVFSVDYRLAPEHPHPAASDDAMAALRWLVDHADTLGIDRDRIVVGGTSAGGSIAAGLAVAARDAGLPVRGLLLEVPVTDLRDEAPWLDRYAHLNGFETMRELRGRYCSDEEAADPRISPLSGELSGLPPVHVMTAELDPLRASGEEFVRRLAAAGNRVTATRHLGHLHGTQSLLNGFRGARLWHAEVIAVLRDFAES